MTRVKGDDPAQGIMRDLSTTMVKTRQPSNIVQGDRCIDITYSTPTLTLTLTMDREYDVTFKEAFLAGEEESISLDKRGTVTMRGETYTQVIPRHQEPLRYNEAMGAFRASLNQWALEDEQ